MASLQLYPAKFSMTAELYLVQKQDGNKFECVTSTQLSLNQKILDINDWE
jgi:hypothetical protein